MDNMNKLKSRLNWAMWLAIISIFVPFVGVVVAYLAYSAKGLMANAFETANAAQDEAEAMKMANQKAAEELNAEREQFYANQGAMVEKLQERKKELENSIVVLNKELGELTKEVIIKAAAFSDLENITSEEVKNKLALLQNKEKDLISAKFKNSFVIEGAGTGKAITNNVKQIIRCFNSECDQLIASINYKNLEVVRGKISKAYAVLNNIFAVDGVALPEELLALKLEAARLVFAYQEKKEQERLQQQEIKAQMIEEEKVRREIEREKAKIEKEEKQFKGEVDKLMKYLQQSQNDIERNLYNDKIRELEEKIKLLEKDKENVLQREQNTRAGFVYVISNIGSFGEDVYKIGMTRRLEPMDRVKELGDASVPFEFDVHAMIFSEDAPALENALHKTFRSKEVNKVNQRKEFFKVDLAEIEKVVKQYHNATVTFTMVAEAKQYRESLKIERGEA